MTNLTKRKSITKIITSDLGYQVFYRIDAVDNDGKEDADLVKTGDSFFATWADLPQKVKNYILSKQNA